MEVLQRTPFSAIISQVLYTQLEKHYRGPDLGDLNGGYSHGYESTHKILKLTNIFVVVVFKCFFYLMEHGPLFKDLPVVCVVLCVTMDPLSN